MYGWDNFEKDWYECPDEDLNFDEELLVREMGTLSPDGYNLKEGGGSNGKHCEESKKKMSENRKGEKSHMYGKTGDKHNCFGKKHSDETKQKMSEAQRGEKGTMYGKIGKNHPMYGRTGENHPKSKKVYQYDLQGNFIRSFGSGNEAARYLREIHGKIVTNGSAINNCAAGIPGYKSAYGFKWSRVMID
jgi:group I intron endonuclease